MSELERVLQPIMRRLAFKCFAVGLVCGALIAWAVGTY